ncbi:carbohydrate ABC transporter ATP-binding protein, CUT1 family (TC 3.A.1.1.-) [Actinopolyspora lacussalsi subsp. righensis]|uniref:Carbohydrate ABC transporter ATP-binding protein, CUT1 family (TC 3.A.1.1.-) n=1 Tax=Actinopolyspora righensis TaxID=995060 RepID=A0A1I6X414_9ACTN|nr:sn-glycerol-3-phosphate ABC transporter ATP-binding protein UgpC [Actinopolyspora righensis]SFT32987.1 carbohydrate ABC transporter ATP-binding protein, CUT1 family (TC 3.A.1.1.-) [Actinopolyspora righensis]
MAEVEYRAATRAYPSTPPVRAVDSLDLEIGDGEFLVLVGPSGSGKSTALRMLAGLEDVDEGGISIGSADVTGTPPKARDIAMVFQSYALYPHMTVGENMGFALKLRKTPKDVIRRKVAEAADMLDLREFLDRKPRALSGGQRQRVAMGRAIVRDPSVFLMDEPLSNLDAKLRVETRANIAALQRKLGTTTIYVTHDQVEAMTMGDRVAVLDGGVLQQVAAPRELYDNPANSFVAGFIGSPAMNLETVPSWGDSVLLGGHRVELPRAAQAAAEGLDEVMFGIRPEALRPVPADEEGIRMDVELVEELGADALVIGSVDVSGVAKRFTVRTDGRGVPGAGETLNLVLRDHEDVHLFHPSTGQRLVA